MYMLYDKFELFCDDLIEMNPRACG